MSRNALIVAQGHNHKALFSNGLWASNDTWIIGMPPTPLKCTCKVRYRQPDVKCTLERVDHALDGVNVRSMLKVTFDEPVSAVAPGQSVVFYNGQDCLGGAIIEAPIKD